MNRLLIYSLLVGTFGFFLVFSLSIYANTWHTSLFRGLFSFILFYLLSLVVLLITKRVMADTSHHSADLQHHLKDKTNYSTKKNDENNLSMEEELEKQTASYVKQLLEDD